MEFNFKVVIVSAVIASVVSVGFGLVGGQSDPVLGGVSNSDQLGVSELKVGSGCNSSFGYAGCTATAITKFLTGTCDLIGTGALAATTSTSYDCAITGITSTDQVFVTGPDSLPCVAAVGCISLQEAHASTTDGFLTISVYNETGIASSTPTVTMKNGWQYLILP